MRLLEQLNISAPPVELTDALFVRLRAFIYDKTGIYFQDGKRYLLESRAGRRLQALGMADFSAYLRLLQHDGMHRELAHLVNAVTINETFFFRNNAQTDVIETDLLPALVRRREQDGTRRIRFWSAACSTGDEPYTLALLIKERYAPRYPHIRFEVLGTDINTEVLETARAGEYGPYAVRNVPPPCLQRHFRQAGDRYQLSPEIRRLVTFRHLNLTDRAAMAALRGFDVIICANVLIYFDAASKSQVAGSLHGALNPGGYLLVGFSETLHGVTGALRPVHLPRAVAYQRA